MDQTVGNVLLGHGIPPAPERTRAITWAEFIRAHLAVLAGTNFFTVKVLTLRGLVTYYVLFFIHLGSRKVEIAGITTQPTEQWMKQMARNVTMDGRGALGDSRYLRIPTRRCQPSHSREVSATAPQDPLPDLAQLSAQPPD